MPICPTGELWEHSAQFYSLNSLHVKDNSCLCVALMKSAQGWRLDTFIGLPPPHSYMHGAKQVVFLLFVFPAVYLYKICPRK